MRLNSLQALSALFLGSSLLVSSCQQPGEALIDRKQRENEAEIQQYLTQNNLNAEKTEEGIYIIKTKTVPNGQEPKIGDQVKYHYIARRLDNVIVDSTDIAANNPRTVTLAGNNTVGITLGLYAGVLKLRAGEEATLLVPSAQDGNREGTLLLPQYSPVRYDLRIVSVRTEEQRIEEYISANKINVTQKTDDGLRVAVTQSRPDSAQVTTGKTVFINYTGKRPDGTVFDSRSDGSFSFQVGAKTVVPGFENGVTKLRVGEKGTLIFPSALGYGATGSYNQSTRTYTVLPYTPLIFEIEVVKIQ